MPAEAELYLDTARLGRMRKSAQRAAEDFARLAGEAALTLYGKNFYEHGFAALAPRQQRRCSQLQSWRGIPALKRRLLRYIAADGDQECLLASRSQSLVRLAAHLLGRRTPRVLLPDVMWAPYAATVSTIVRGYGGEVVSLPLREEIFAARLTAGAVIDRIVTATLASRCQGVCLPAISHDGVRLPVGQLVGELRRALPASLILVDAAQALGQAADDFGVNAADLVIGGAHKWLRAGMPLGIAIGPARNIRQLTSLPHDDPLLGLTTPSGFGGGPETVNLWPLITCNAVLGTPHKASSRLVRAAQARELNRRRLLAVIEGSGWQSRIADAELRSGIELLQRVEQAQTTDAGRERARFRRRGVALTSYPGPMLRLSLPGRPLDARRVQLFADAL